MKIRVLIQAVMTAGMLAFIGGCGSGGGTSGNSKFVSKGALAGPLNPGVKGVEITLVLPAVATPEINAATGQPVVTLLPPNNVTDSNGILSVTYTPTSGTTPGKVKIGVIRGDIPFRPGDFFNVPCVIAAGQSVTADNFSTEGLRVWDSNGADITSSTSVATITVQQ